MKNITIKEIRVKAKAGSVLNDCIIEGIELATKEKQVVILTHNDTIYKIDPISITDTIRQQGNK